jgi:hypothetical protein
MPLDHINLNKKIPPPIELLSIQETLELALVIKKALPKKGKPIKLNWLFTINKKMKLKNNLKRKRQKDKLCFKEMII